MTARLSCAVMIAAWLLLIVLGSASAQGSSGAIVLTRVEGTITPVLADHLHDTLADAATANASLVVIELDTPGGLDVAMRQIVQDILASPIPVAVHVTPPGARAASAGSVITLAAHVAVMTPGTNIGAATPVDVQAGTVLDKFVNDAAAYVQALAELRGRNVDFYVESVREGRSVSANDALQIGAIDLIADDISDLLSQADGLVVDVEGRAPYALQTRGVDVVRADLSGIRALLQRIADPNIAFALLSLGSLAILYEIANPGGGFGGAIGAIMLVLAFFSLSALPVNVAGLILLVVAVAFFIAEAFVPGVGAFAGGGTVSLLVAGLLLFQRSSGVGVSVGLVLGIAAITGVASVWIGYVGVTTRSAPPVVGAAGTMLGATGVVKETNGVQAQVLVEGARWQAVSASGLRPGDLVQVTAVDGLLLTVETVA